MKRLVKNIIREAHILILKAKLHNHPNIVAEGRVLIVAPHPDDEVIGCGGLISRLVAEGNAPQIVVMTGGEGSHRGCCNLPDEDIKNARRGLTRKALGILGVPGENIHELNFPDGGIDVEKPQVDDLKGLINEIKPHTVFVPHWGEGWPDHVRTAEIVISTISSDIAVYEYCVWMWYYNVWRGLDWKNAAILTMSPKEHELKLRAMDAYIKPLAPCGRPWSGVLPDIFVKANQWHKELYFKVK